MLLLISLWPEIRDLWRWWCSWYNQEIVVIGFSISPWPETWWLIMLTLVFTNRPGIGRHGIVAERGDNIDDNVTHRCLPVTQPDPWLTPVTMNHSGWWDFSPGPATSQSRTVIGNSACLFTCVHVSSPRLSRAHRYTKRTIWAPWWCTCNIFMRIFNFGNVGAKKHFFWL